MNKIAIVIDKSQLLFINVIHEIRIIIKNKIKSQY